MPAPEEVEMALESLVSEFPGRAGRASKGEPMQNGFPFEPRRHYRDSSEAYPDKNYRAAPKSTLEKYTYSNRTLIALA